jgi:hypothetical protein
MKHVERRDVCALKLFERCGRQQLTKHCHRLTSGISAIRRGRLKRARRDPLGVQAETKVPKTRIRFSNDEKRSKFRRQLFSGCLRINSSRYDVSRAFGYLMSGTLTHCVENKTMLPDLVLANVHSV